MHEERNDFQVFEGRKVRRHYRRNAEEVHREIAHRRNRYAQETDWIQAAGYYGGIQAQENIL